jgi:hypothetical protein
MSARKSPETVRVGLVDPMLARRPVNDEPGVLEYLQVLRDRRPADRKRIRQLAHGLGVCCEALEDGPPGRVAECRPAARRVSLG